ncbi:N-6 DNA methylase [Ruminiclostridium sufflavum DSM 19573]|uniref:site-specific DNA-methyltransferase (adenine-specific) n=1 Tax=Ruminiclostridium sufflavum DSM 19573 TaxID=1121337 RepID=A0A318XHT4_9FIRM|nr:N-6 DNA methylase [Ruminiclostridium sufflavum]PYG86770.1 N-6 DNA methylase [Ruminiclostridium sufflavum DSM 19573]
MDNVYRSFYTKNNYITKYMVSMIAPTPSDKILEPCGGDGVFIDTMLELGQSLNIDTCDLNIEAVETLKRKYSYNEKIKIRLTDTLMDEVFDRYAENGHYDKIVGNPPYGGWQEYDRRDELKKKYNGFYVKETYSLFLLRCVSILRNKGVLSFIIPDTFLFLHNHTALRKYLLENTKIKEILIFPSKFFPGVSFGYSNLSIITVEKTHSTHDALNNTFNVIKGLKVDRDIERIGLRSNIDDLETITLTQRDVYNNEHHAFILSNDILSDIISNCETKLGDIAECVTGIYTGNNLGYMGVVDASVKNSKDYPVVPVDLIDFNCNSLQGTDEAYKYIPIIKSSSSTKYVRIGNDWLIDWSKDAIKHYNTDKKARFQNSSYYFRTGIGLPMVKSSKINATLMVNRVFDQSIVGIFPKDEKHLYFLLGFLNSDIANKLIHLINPTANNSSNYLKKLPVILTVDSDLEYITSLVKTIVETGNIDKGHDKINEYFNHLFNIE